MLAANHGREHALERLSDIAELVRTLGFRGADVRIGTVPAPSAPGSARTATRKHWFPNPAAGRHQLASHRSSRAVTLCSEMDSNERRSALRAAVYRGDGLAVVELLQDSGSYDDALQLAGDGLSAAVMQQVEGAPELARRLVVLLRQRDWAGDDELADQLDAQLGSGPAPMLRPLPVDLDELADILEGDPLNAGGRIDLTTGEVWAQAAIEYVLETGEQDEDSADDPERWLAVHNEGSREGYRDMELFIASVEDPGRAERLARAIAGRGAFRRFKDELARWPGELERWHALSEERQRGRARSWLTEAGYRVEPAARRDP